jgi:uncharacterized damage-inducible protein DinB
MPQTFPALQITAHWQEVQDQVLHILDLIPDEKLNWTPKADLWNARGILIHIADARDQWLTRDVKDGDEYPNIWTTARTKDDIKRELERSFQRMQRFLANQGQLDATYVNDHDGRSYDGHWIAFHLLEHDIHHRAELLQRLALLGIEHGIDI